jgi:mannose-6-phosphate isomerase
MTTELGKAAGLGPFRLAPWFSPRPWGRMDLRPWYSETGKTEPVGEAWLTGPESIVETGALAGSTLAAVVAENGRAIVGALDAEFPLLIKLLFPNDKLSVQVHPDDVHAQEMGQPRGKTECWYVLEAEPNASIALGLKQGATADAVREAIAGGTLEELMQWVPVNVGEMIFVDAGTVHAIGPGVVLLETQQTCDVTFRMYDYGRPRELHVEQALKVMRAKTDAGKVAAREMDGFTRLIEQKYFTVDRYDVAAGDAATIDGGVPTCLVGLRGAAEVEWDGGEPVDLRAGQAVVVPVSVDQVRVRTEDGISFARCIAPLVPDEPYSSVPVMH